MMKVDELTEPERKIWQAATTGALVDLRVGNLELDSPTRWAEWGAERTVRAEVIADLLLGDCEAASMTVRGVRLQGARIVGELNLEAMTLQCPLALLECSFASAINLEEATTRSIRLSGSHLPTVRARQLQTCGDLRLDKGFSVSGGIDLTEAHISGDLCCTGGQFSNPDGCALAADELTVDGEMDCNEGFTATGEVRLRVAHIGGQLICRGGQFSNPGGCALAADELTVESIMFCDKGFKSTGEVILAGAHIGGQLVCTGGQFSNPDGCALRANRLTVDGSMICGKGFTASGEVSLPGAHIGGQLVCTGGQFSNPDGCALFAVELNVEQDMICGKEFTASGEVSLVGAHIGGIFDCTGGQFSNSGGCALRANRLTVDGSMFCGKGFTATGEVSLLGAHIGGVFNCTGGQFSNPDGYALSAERLAIDGNMLCNEGFTATGEVSLVGAHVVGVLNCTGGQFSNSGGYALSADGLIVEQDMICRKGFVATGKVSLFGAHIGGQLGCAGGQFSNPDGFALSADGLTVDRGLDCGEGFTATGGVRLVRAHISGVLNCKGGQFSNPNPDGWALLADGLTVDGDMFCDEGFAATGEVRLRGAHISGHLNCTGGQFSNPNPEGWALVADELTVEQDMFCNEGFAATGEVSLAGAHISGVFRCTGGQFSNPNPDGCALLAERLAIDGNMLCNEGFTATGEVSLAGAHIGGQLVCTGGQFSNPGGNALVADGLTVKGEMVCGKGFVAIGKVSLFGAHIGGVLNCAGGQFSNPRGFALLADGLTVDRGLFCGEGFTATGGVRLVRAHISGHLNCTGGQFSNPNPDGWALLADGLTVDGDMFCDEGFAATGEVRLRGAHISGHLNCTGGQFSNPNPEGWALVADELTVEQDMRCDEGFAATGEVSLAGAHISGVFRCTGGQFSNAGDVALNLQRTTMIGSLSTESTVLKGILDLTAAVTGSYHDNQAFWPQKLRLDGFVYGTIEGASVKKRLEWLLRNESGYSPQIYDQLAAVYRRTGHDEDARSVLITKQRRRFAQRNPLWKVWGYLLDMLVGYGYRTWLAALWLIGFLILGTILFGYVYRGDLTPANKPDVQPPFQPIFYTLDLLLPVASLHMRDAWIAHGAAQWWSVFFILMGWVLATAVVLSLTGLLKRD